MLPHPATETLAPGPWAVGPGPCAGELFQDRLFYVATSQLGRQREEGGVLPRFGKGGIEPLMQKLGIKTSISKHMDL